MTTQILQKWNKVKLGDVAEIESGGTPSSTKSEYWDGGNICWATLPDLKNKYILDTQRKITPLGLKNSSAKLLPINSVIFSSRATIGEISIAKVETATNQGSKNFICDPKKLDYEFLYYLLKSKIEEIKQLASGATYKEINKTVFSGVEVDLPDLKQQKHIAAVLAVYDALIENNICRTKILEQMTQSVYTEWFINAEDIQEWDKIGLDKVIDINPSHNTKNQKGFKKIPMERLSNNLMLIETENLEIVSKVSGSKFRNHDVLFARITPCLENGKTGYVHFLQDNEIAIGSTEFVVMRGNQVPSTFVYCLARDPNFRTAAQKTMTGASGRQRVSNDFFKEYKISLPPKNLLQKFHDLAFPIFVQIETLRKENEGLKKTRSLLIPKLVTGELII